MARVVLAASARLDLAEATLWYAEESPDLGERFHGEYKRVRARVAENPRRWPVIEPDIRRVVFREFPYSMFYSVEHDHVLVLAIMHHSRDPDHWRRRR